MLGSGRLVRGRHGGDQLIQVEAEGTHRAVRFDEGQGDDRLAGPAGEVVDVERYPRRQQDDLRGQRRHPLPRPQPEQRQPQVREHARPLEPALGADEGGRRPHVGLIRTVAGQAQRPVGLDRRRQLPRSAVEVGPGAVGALLGADPGGRALGLGLLANAEELPQEHVLGVHRHVRLQLSPPPAALLLQREQVLDPLRERELGATRRLDGQLRHARKARSFSPRRTPGRALASAAS